MRVTRGTLELLREAEVLVTWTGLPGDPLRAAPLRERAPHLRILSFTSAGVDRLARVRDLLARVPAARVLAEPRLLEDVLG